MSERNIRNQSQPTCGCDRLWIGYSIQAKLYEAQHQSTYILRIQDARIHILDGVDPHGERARLRRMRSLRSSRKKGKRTHGYALRQQLNALQRSAQHPTQHTCSCQWLFAFAIRWELKLQGN